MDTEKAVAMLIRIDRRNRINCTGLGEVGCEGREGWHSWDEHRRHVAAEQIEALTEAGIITAGVSA